MSVDYFLRAAALVVRRALTSLQPLIDVTADGTLRVDGKSIGVVDISSSKTTLSGRGPAQRWLAGVGFELAKRCDTTLFDPQDGSVVKAAPALAEVIEAVRAAHREAHMPALAAPAQQTPRDEAMALLKLLNDRGCVLARATPALVDSVVPLLRSPAQLSDLLLDHDDVDEVYASDEELAEVLEAWG